MDTSVFFLQGDAILQTIVQSLSFPVSEIRHQEKPLSASKSQLVWNLIGSEIPEFAIAKIDLIEKLFLYRLEWKQEKAFLKQYSGVLDIQSTREAKEQAFFDTIQKEASFALLYNKDRFLPPMNTRDRQRVHAYIGEFFPSIQTQSLGEEPNRSIRLRNSNRKK